MEAKLAYLFRVQADCGGVIEHVEVDFMTESGESQSIAAAVAVYALDDEGSQEAVRVWSSGDVSIDSIAVDKNVYVFTGGPEITIESQQHLWLAWVHDTTKIGPFGADGLNGDWATCPNVEDSDFPNMLSIGDLQDGFDCSLKGAGVRLPIYISLKCG